MNTKNLKTGDFWVVRVIQGHWQNGSVMFDRPYMTSYQALIQTPEVWGEVADMGGICWRSAGSSAEPLGRVSGGKAP